MIHVLDNNCIDS